MSNFVSKIHGSLPVWVSAYVISKDFADPRLRKGEEGRKGDRRYVGKGEETGRNLKLKERFGETSVVRHVSANPLTAE
jgi:hypothetical protein